MRAPTLPRAVRGAGSVPTVEIPVEGAAGSASASVVVVVAAPRPEEPAPDGPPVAAEPGGPANLVPAENAAPGAEARPAGTASSRVVRGWAAALSRLSGGSAVATTRLSDRLSERVAARRRLTRRKVLLGSGVVVLVAAIAYVVLFSPVLAVRADAIALTVSGPAVDPAAVTAVLSESVGTPLARVDVAAMEAIVHELPGVRDVDVARSWPNGLTVDVVARYPVAAVPRDGVYALLDTDGVQVGGAVAQPPEGLPVVEVPLGDEAAAALDAVLVVLGGLPAALLAEIGQAGAASPDTVWFGVADGARVEWGSVASAELKARVLEVLRQRPADVYDVSAPSMPVTR